MTTNNETLRDFEKRIGKIANQLNIKDPEIAPIARDALLISDAFLRAKVPIIAVTGITYTGKSSLINRIFGEKKLEEGLTADTTNRVVKIRFKSGLLIYDTPGAGGLQVEWENITRAFLGLKQLDCDLDGNKLEVIAQIPTVDASNYNKDIDEPKAFIRPKDFEPVDLFIFVVDIRAGALRREDIMFYREVVTLGKPVIVVLNKIDEMEDRIRTAALTYIGKNLAQDAIPVSARTGEKIEELITTIIKRLPTGCGEILGEVINHQYRTLVRHQQIKLYSIVTAVKTAQIVGSKGSIDNARQLVSNIIGLYGWIINKYNLPETKLKKSGIIFSDLAYSVETKMQESKKTEGKIGITLAGSIVGLTLGVIVTGGMIAIPTVILGTFSGGSLSALIGSLYGVFKREQVLDMKTEAKSLERFISSASKYETAVSVLAFGLSLNNCCEMLEKKTQVLDFHNLFQEEYTRISVLLKPFSERLSRERINNEDDLIKDIFHHLTLEQKS